MASKRSSRLWVPEKLPKSKSLDDHIIPIVQQNGFMKSLRLLRALNIIPKNFPNRLHYICELSGIEADKLLMLKDLESHLSSSNILDEITDQEGYLWAYSSKPYVVYLAPKVNRCIIDDCCGKLYATDKPSEITVFTMSGAKPGLKVVLTCRACKARYGISKYHRKCAEEYLLPPEYSHDFIEVSNGVLFSRDLHEWMCESGNHGFVSGQSFAEIYNTVYGSRHVSSIKYTECLKSHGISKPDTLIMTRKNATEAFFNGELQAEIYERNLQDSMPFARASSREDLMKKIDVMRRSEIYSHRPEDCTDFCRTRGCQDLRVVDGCWKLCIPHCMLAVETSVDGQPLLNFPNVCTQEPMSSSVFCEQHHKMLQKNDIPTDKQDFLNHIGCKGSLSSQATIRDCDEKVVALMKDLTITETCNIGTSASDYQGTNEIIKKMKPSVFDGQTLNVSCNKDTGEKSRLRQRARGHFAAVSGGGNILYFNPIYKSESPSQIFMLVIQMIYLEMKDVPEDQLDTALKNYILCYDNMCHLDILKAAQEELPLPGPLKNLWKKIRKVIDRLHIKNHKDKKCLKKYNPKDIPDSYNTMAGEQMFSWMSRFKKIVNSMTQTHHLFYLHRMCKRRNKYTAECHKRGAEPVFPGINKKLI